MLGWVDEGVDDKTNLGPVLLGDLVDQRVGAALDQERIVAPADHLQPDEEVGDVLDLVVLDAIEAGVLAHGALVAGTGGAEGGLTLPGRYANISQIK